MKMKKTKAGPAQVIFANPYRPRTWSRHPIDPEDLEAGPGILVESEQARSWMTILHPGLPDFILGNRPSAIISHHDQTT
jgi:hypothetical protein